MRRSDGMSAGVCDYRIGPDDWWVISSKAAIIMVFLATSFAYLTLAGRKIAAHIQLRIGPNRVGPFGLLQPLADGIKLLFKENVAPSGRDRLLYLIAPLSPPAWRSSPSLPPGRPPQHRPPLHLCDHSAGRVRALPGRVAANSKYSLLGALRASTQLISYELAVAFAASSVAPSRPAGRLCSRRS
jgi:NADH-quinone oxidoreductase subunit H